jgi:uncharacterized membrane protein YcaP (DUF421 family)
MFELSIGSWEFVIRAVVVYAFLFALMRFVGKKHVGELAPFDLVVLLILSETVQNSLVSDDKSLVGGLISAATLVGLVQLVGYASWRSRSLDRVLEGVPKILVWHGRRCEKVMARERITISELTEALRHQGCSNILQVRAAVLENDGTISVIMRDRPP